ncbi:MAG TPA: hypothetical protein VFA07_14110 [Chthonomonadaceae bacterium]|nr:hypothetical protein [Chthonomonadaceae bacterium]
MSDGDLSFAPLAVPEIKPKESHLPVSGCRFPGRMVRATASTPTPITASRLEIGGTWVQKVEFAIFEEVAGGPESDPEPATEKPVVLKAAGETAQPHPVLSPPRSAYGRARTGQRKPVAPQRVPARRLPIRRDEMAASAPIPDEAAAPSCSPETAARIREAKTDPRRIAKIDSCFLR